LKPGQEPRTYLNLESAAPSFDKAPVEKMDAKGEKVIYAPLAPATP
jgi:hypothetical protein